jgi:phosphatidylserine synthase
LDEALNARPTFRIEPEGVWVLVRLLVGFAATILAQIGWLSSAGAAMVLCVCLDGVVGFVFRRHQPKSANTVALETYADAVCFVAAPIQFAAALAKTALPIILLPVFLLAATYRLARFDVEGLVNGGYAGLPVTYNGLLFPAAGLAVHFFPGAADWILAGLLLAVSALMISRRLVVPEV